MKKITWYIIKISDKSWVIFSQIENCVFNKFSIDVKRKTKDLVDIEQAKFDQDQIGINN